MAIVPSYVGAWSLASGASCKEEQMDLLFWPHLNVLGALWTGEILGEQCGVSYGWESQSAQWPG